MNQPLACVVFELNSVTSFTLNASQTTLRIRAWQLQSIVNISTITDLCDRARDHYQLFVVGFVGSIGGDEMAGARADEREGGQTERGRAEQQELGWSQAGHHFEVRNLNLVHAGSLNISLPYFPVQLKHKNVQQHELC